jgi:Flp pilus assembly protein TadB
VSAGIGWLLAVLSIALGYAVYGWPGVALAVTAMVFWLLLQFSRAMRVMRVAGQAPIGIVPSAVMVQARLREGLRLMDIIVITRSLGEKIAETPETYRWRDNSGAAVEVELVGGRCRAWRFTRPEAAEEGRDDAGAGA